MGTFNSPEGQGMSTTVCLKMAKLHSLSAGSGGLGGQAYNYTDGGGTHAFSVSGGGGGVLFDGNGVLLCIKTVAVKTSFVILSYKLTLIFVALNIVLC